MTPIIISKQGDKWLIDYDPPEGASVGGIRWSCGSRDRAVEKAREFRKMTGLNMNIEVKEGYERK
jgi:hypothetical protein